jgi:hypothetical protein
MTREEVFEDVVENVAKSVEAKTLARKWVERWTWGENRCLAHSRVQGKELSPERERWVKGGAA